MGRYCAVEGAVVVEAALAEGTGDSAIAASMIMSSSVRRKAGGSDARRNRGQRIGATTVCVSMWKLYRRVAAGRRKCVIPGEIGAGSDAAHWW